MDTLFTANIIVNGENKSYEVSFEDDQYLFRPDGKEAPSFSLRRTHDEWKVAGSLPEIACQQAVSALEHYLLSQH